MKVIYGEVKEYDYEVKGIESLGIEEIVDCFRGWVQKIQLLSMDTSKMPEVQKQAAYAAQAMR